MLTLDIHGQHFRSDKPPPASEDPISPSWCYCQTCHIISSSALPSLFSCLQFPPPSSIFPLRWPSSHPPSFPWLPQPSRNKMNPQFGRGQYLLRPSVRFLVAHRWLTPSASIVSGLMTLRNVLLCDEVLHVCQFVVNSWECIYIILILPSDFRIILFVLR